MEPDIKLFVAMKAFIVHQGKVFLLRESSHYGDGSNLGKYDVVGGRVKPGERFDAGLLREIEEETGLKVKMGNAFCVNEWRPVVRGEQWHIVATFIECFADSKEVALSIDHDDYIWIDAQDYTQYPIIETNWPAFEAYLQK